MRRVRLSTIVFETLWYEPQVSKDIRSSANGKAKRNRVCGETVTGTKPVTFLSGVRLEKNNVGIRRQQRHHSDVVSWDASRVQS